MLSPNQKNRKQENKPFTDTKKDKILWDKLNKGNKRSIFCKLYNIDERNLKRHR